MYEEFTDLTPAEAAAYMEDRRTQPVRTYLADRTLRTLRGAPAHARVLDAGCGNGIDAQFYDFSMYLGVDISEPLLEAARKAHPLHKFMNGDLTALALRDYSYDVVICKSVLVHLPSQELALQAIQELKRVAGRALFIAWAGAPWSAAPGTVRVPGHFGKLVYQNTYDRAALFAAFGADRWTTGSFHVDTFEVWEGFR